MKGAAAFIHFPGVIEKADVGEDGAEAVVGLGKIVLEGESTLEFGDSFEVLEIFGGTPEEKSAGEVSFGQVWIEFERAAAVEFGAFEPFAGGIEFVIAGGTNERESCMREGKSGIARDGVAEVLSGLFESGGIAGGAETVAAHEFGIGHGVPAVAGTTLRGERSYRPVQSEGDLPGDVVFEIGDAADVEIVFPGKQFTLSVRVQ
jgi:hypothetical protein